MSWGHGSERGTSGDDGGDGGINAWRRARANREDDWHLRELLVSSSAIQGGAVPELFRLLFFLSSSIPTPSL